MAGLVSQAPDERHRRHRTSWQGLPVGRSANYIRPLDQSLNETLGFPGEKAQDLLAHRLLNSFQSMAHAVLIILGQLHQQRTIAIDPGHMDGIARAPADR